MGVDSFFKAGTRVVMGRSAGAGASAAARGSSGFAGKALTLGMGYGIVKGIGNAVSGAGSGGGSNDNASNSRLTSKFGIVGSAGRHSGSAGGGVMPNYTQMSSIAVQRNASQLVILETAVKLLSSIDSSLKVQNKQQEFIARQQILQQREMLQEETQGKSSFAERISNIRNSKTGSILANILKTSLLGAGTYLAFKLASAETTVTDVLKQANDILIKVGLGTIAAGALIKGGKGAYNAFKTTRAAEKAAKLAAEQAATTAAAGRAIGKGGMTAAQYSAYQLYRKMGMGAVAAKRQAIRTHQPPAAGSYQQMERNAGLRGAEGATKTSLLKTLLKGGAGGLIKGGLKGMKLPALFEAFLYATGIQELTGRNIAGTVGSLIGGALGSFGGIFGSVAGAYAGSYVTTKIYDWFTGKPSASGKDQGSYVPSGDKKVDFAMQYLMKELGLTSAQASGIVGNLMGESRLDTNAFNSAGGGRGAYGIAQWRGARQDALDAFAASRGKRRDDYETQLAFLVKELKENPSNGLAELKAARTTEEATKVFLDKFERPSELDKARSIRKRIAFSMAAASGTSMDTAQSDYSDQAAAAAGFEGSEGLVGLLETQEKLANVMKKLAPTNVMTKMAPVQKTSEQAATAIQSQAAAMEAALRGKSRADAQNAPPTLMGVKSPRNISNPSGGAFTCPNPGYEDSGMIDYLVYFGLAA